MRERKRKNFFDASLLQSQKDYETEVMLLSGDPN